MPRRPHPILWLALLTCTTSLAHAADTPAAATQPARGTFTMRPDLVGQHPRLFFTKADIPELRRQAAGDRKFFAELTRRTYGGMIGQEMPDTPRGWKRYLYGFWALFGLDMMAVVDGDERAAATARQWALKLSRTEWWVKDDLSPMDTLSGLALTYDILYDQFTPAERKQLRAAIHRGAVFIGERFFVQQYWTRDYQNNHMHNRIHALAMASFAIYGDDPEFDVQAQADLAMSQIHNVLKWLPADGSQHEGPGYWTFGHHWLTRAIHLAEHVTGEKLAERNRHMATAHLYRMYMTAPGWKATMNIGDSGAGPLESVTPLLRSAAETRDPHLAGLLKSFMTPGSDLFYRHGPWGLLWYDATVPTRPVSELPLWHVWPDVEMLSIRSSWDADATAFVFKCGPVGGHTLQRLRADKGDGWVNVAHDHPDQNHFLLFAHGKMLAADDGYPKRQKLTSNHNTIIIDGKGQPREGTGWQQPFPYENTGTMNDVFCSTNTAFAAGDASRLYDSASRFIRYAAFVDGRYVVLMDDLVGAGEKPHQFQWRLHNAGDWTERGPGHFSVAEDDVSLDIRFLGDVKAMTSEFLPAAKPAQPCLAVTQTGRKARFLTVLTPQKAEQPAVNAQEIDGRGCVAVRVSGSAGEDLIAIAGEPAEFTAGRFSGQGAGGIATFGPDGLRMAMVVRGTSLRIDGKPLLVTSKPVNMSWRRDRGILIEIEGPYKITDANAVLRVSGLARNEPYQVTLNDEPPQALRSDRRGTLRFDVNLLGRNTLRIEDGAVSSQ